MRDRLEIYWQILGPHAAELEPRVDVLARAMAGKGSAWYREQRSRHGDPFVELEQIVRETWENRLEYAAERVAVAGAAQQTAPRLGEDPASRVSPTAQEMLEAYQRDLGEHKAKEVRAMAKTWYRDFVRHQTPDWVRHRAGELADPYPTHTALDRKIGQWIEDNRGPAAKLFALDRAEQEAAGRDRSGRAEPPPARPGGREREAERKTEPEVEQLPSLLRGESLTARIEERRQVIAADLKDLSEEELKQKADAHGRGFTERAAALRAEALRLESEGAISAPPDVLLRRAVDAEISTRDNDVAPIDRAALASTADYLRQQVVENRRFVRSLADVHDRWVDLHAEQAALAAIPERAPVAARDTPGSGPAMD